MNPIIERVCSNFCVEPSKFFSSSKASNVAAARCEAIRRLKRAGLSRKEIAGETQLHVQTVYYWLNPPRRESQKRAMRLRTIGGKRQTKEQRQEIVDAYLANPAKGTALACSRGLSPLYAWKLVNALGLLPRKGEK